MRLSCEIAKTTSQISEECSIQAKPQAKSVRDLLRHGTDCLGNMGIEKKNWDLSPGFIMWGLGTVERTWGSSIKSFTLLKRIWKKPKRSQGNCEITHKNKSPPFSRWGNQPTSQTSSIPRGLFSSPLQAIEQMPTLESQLYFDGATRVKPGLAVGLDCDIRNHEGTCVQDFFASLVRKQTIEHGSVRRH